MKVTAPILTPQEMASTAWTKLEQTLDARLASYRTQLEALGTTPDRRADLVARIDELKSFLKLGRPAEERTTAAG